MERQTQPNEISTNYFFARIKGFFRGILLFFVEIFREIHKNGKIFYPALFLLIALGAFLDYKRPEKYKNEILVAANYGSSEYLYDEIRRISTFKENTNDKQEIYWLKKISGAEVEPLRNPYDFLKNNYDNTYFFSLLSERNINLEKYFESKMMDKNFRYHKITFSSDISKDSTEFLAKFLLDKLNDNTYFNERMSLEQANIQKKKDEYEASVKQINELFKSLSERQTDNGSSVAINEYQGIHQLVEQKRKLIEQMDLYDIYLLEGKRPIFPVYISVNKKAIQIPYFILFPFIFTLFGLLILTLVKQTRRYRKRN